MDTETAINEAQAPGTFDVLAFVEQTAYPEQEVVIFQDAKSADLYSKKVAKRFELERSEDEGDKAAVEELTTDIEALGKLISDSALVFRLRGLPPGFVRDIWLDVPEELDEKSTADFERERDNDLIAKTILRVSNSKGAVDPSVWDKDKVGTLRKYLKEGEFGKLVKAVSEVNFNAMVFDQATDAGFSGRSSDLA